MKADSVTSNPSSVASSPLVSTTAQPEQIKRSKKTDAIAGSGPEGNVSTKSLPQNYDVSLSNQAKELSDARKKALKIARETPDIREDRVAELKKKIKEGTYEVNAGNIADGILREAIKEDLATKKDLDI